jgi:hypothetical protein
MFIFKILKYIFCQNYTLLGYDGGASLGWIDRLINLIGLNGHNVP